MKISIVTPIFNESDCVEQLIKGLQEQTYDDLEFVLVDDASTDDSLDKMQSLSETDRRIRIISHATNRGGGGASNSGINASTGDYVFIHDADDRLTSPDSIRTLAEIALRNEDDIVIGGTLSLVPVTEAYASTALNKVNIFNIPTLVYNHSVWNKLYRKEFLVENDFTLQEDKDAYDVLFSARTNLAAKSVSITPKNTYFYQTGRQTARVTPVKIVDARENVAAALKLMESANDEQLTCVSQIKTLRNSFTTLKRASLALEAQGMQEHLRFWQTELSHIPESRLDELPDELREFHVCLRQGKLDKALERWRSSRSTFSPLNSRVMDALRPMLNNPDKPRLIKLAKMISRRLN